MTLRCPACSSTRVETTAHRGVLGRIGHWAACLDCRGAWVVRRIGEDLEWDALERKAAKTA